MDISNYEYNTTVEKVVEIMMAKTQNYDPQFFRLQTNFFLTLIPSVMNMKIASPITGTIPINFYGCSLLRSGSGKGFSTNILEGQVINQFKTEFMENLFPVVSQMALESEASRRAALQGMSDSEMLEVLEKEFKSYGAYQFSFDSATTPAVKQIRNKIILAKCGAINIIIDEIGLNLGSSGEVLTSLLELYDKGLIRNKLIKNSESAIRYQELNGSTPANLLMFGSPSKLLNASSTEDQFFEFLETGYARRCFFNYSKPKEQESTLSPEQQYELITKSSDDEYLASLSLRLALLADGNKVGKSVQLPKEAGIFLVEYRQWCEARAKELPEYEDIQRSELAHRYFKVLKLAGAYAFIEGLMEISKSHLQQAIRFAEDSGEAVSRLFHREKPYERLARYIAYSKGTNLTQVDIQNDLPFYKGTKAVKDDMMNMAIAWGYKNNIIIKKTFKDGIEFISGETLEENDLSSVILAYSQQWSDGYINANGDKATKIPFDKLSSLLTAPDYHWTNHYTKTGRRSSSDMAEGFNVVVLDIDSGATIQEVSNLMKDYRWIIHTTKRHMVLDPETGKQNERFRMVIPLNYTLKLSNDEFKEFMKNLAQWLPFTGLDEQTFQPSRKWASYADAEVFTNEGMLLDVTPFIPRTSRNEEYQKQVQSLGSMDNVERWFASRMQQGNRNNYLAQYGFMLMDAGISADNAGAILMEFNKKLQNPLDESEIIQTVLTSLKNREHHG